MNARYELRIVELLQEIRDDQRRLLRLLEEVRPRPARPNARHVALYLAIHATTEGRAFTGNELCDHAQFVPGLKAAIQAAVKAISPRRLGKLFRKLEGEAVGGLVIERASVDSRDGVVWTCRKFESLQTRQTSFA